MPNPKLGTVTAAVGEAVKAARQGQVTYKTDKAGVVHVACGKLSFTHEALMDNVAALVRAVVASRPPGAKGNLIRTAFLHSTHGPSVPLDLKQEPFRTQMQAAQGKRPVIEAARPAIAQTQPQPQPQPPAQMQTQKSA